MSSSEAEGWAAEMEKMDGVRRKEAGGSGIDEVVVQVPRLHLLFAMYHVLVLRRAMYIWA